MSCRGSEQKGTTVAKEVETLFVSTTEPAVLAFSTAVDGKSKFAKNGEQQFMVIVEPTPNDLKMLKGKAAECARAAYPGRDLKDLVFPFKRSKDNPDVAVIKARSDYAPSLSVLENGKVKELGTPVDLQNYRKWFFGGAKVLIGVTFRPYTVDGKDGVSAKLGMVLSVAPSDKSGGRAAAEVFKGYVGTISSEDPGGFSTGLDDEISF